MSMTEINQRFVDGIHRDLVDAMFKARLPHPGVAELHFILRGSTMDAAQRILVRERCWLDDARDAVVAAGCDPVYWATTWDPTPGSTRRILREDGFGAPSIEAVRTDPNGRAYPNYVYEP